MAGNSKIIYGDTTLIDLTQDTVTVDKVLEGYTFHDKTGEARVGIMQEGGGGVPVDDLVITTPATKLTFNIGERFNITGLVVTATLGHLVGDVTQDCVISPTVGTIFTEDDLGNRDVTIGYGGETITYSIYVRAGIEIKPWATATDAELEEMLTAHYAGEIDLHDAEGWEIGAEREVALSAIPRVNGLEAHVAKTVKFVLLNKGGKILSDGSNTECAFIVGTKTTIGENSLNLEYGRIGYYNSETWEHSNNRRRPWLNDSFRNSITSSSLRALFKQFKNEIWSGSGSNIKYIDDYFSFASLMELTGLSQTTYTGHSVQSANADEGSQFEYYKTASNRIKPTASNQYPQNCSYWTRTKTNGIYNNYAYYKADDNTTDWTDYSADSGIAPFGVI